jgi:FkbM family methyltransferase
MKILYGTKRKNIDVTNICFNKLFNNNIITIPSDDSIRIEYFSDPNFEKKKMIYLVFGRNIIEYNEDFIIQISLLNNAISSINAINQKCCPLVITDNGIIECNLSKIQSKLKLNYGSFLEELPEQKMVTRFLNGQEKVLEIGANIGRNSLIIASIVGSDNFVTLECDENIAKQLEENKNLNNFNFQIEVSALSKKKLIQKGWDTFQSDVVLDGFKPVNTITFNELKEKYNINFDTLVLDCEGAFYYILSDMPEILSNINLIIMENDYHNIEHKQYVDNTMIQNNFVKVYSEVGGWRPCFNSFFETWKRLDSN